MKLHRHAALSLKKRELLCQRVVEEEWSLSEAAAAAEVSERTAGKWVRRFDQLPDGDARATSPATRPPYRASRRFR